MKRILFILLIAVSFTYGQNRSTATPYSISGWDSPADSTQYYELAIFQLLSNPGGWINRNTRAIDSLLNALVVFIDSSQMVLQDDTLRFSNYMSGQGAFSGTVQYDTIDIVGIDSLDAVVVSAREAVLTANDLLSVKVIDDKIIIQRPASGTSGLKYNWIWIRKYD